MPVTNSQELEKLAQVIFEEIQQSFRDQGHNRGKIDTPWPSLNHVIKSAYIRAASAANTHLINLNVQQSVKQEDEYTLALTEDEITALARCMNFYLQDIPGKSATPEEIQTFLLLLNIVGKMPDME